VNPTFIGLELRRVVRDVPAMFFIVVLPAFFYLVFGAGQDYSDQAAGNGNVAMYILIAMAGYGAATAMTGTGGFAAVERLQGWSRQLGVTPVRDRQLVAGKTIVALALVVLPIGAVFALGPVTGAEADPGVWLLSALALTVGAVVWALYGLCFGLAFRSEAAVSIGSGVLVVLAFLGNVFIPLSGTLLTIAKFTPLYGYVALARHPLTDGVNIDGSGRQLPPEPLWMPVANVIAWTVVFALVATWLIRRGRSRQ